MIDPRFKTVPYKHQLEAFERFKDDPYFALFFEQRVGKTLTSLIIAAHKYRQGEIDSLLVISPNGVNRVWHAEEIPAHMPEDVNARSELWQASKVKQVGVRRTLAELLEHTGLRVLCVNIDAIDTAEFKMYANAFFYRHKVMTIIDESSDISNPKAARTKAALRLSGASRVRAILDGTPVAAGPMGLFGQCNFLSPDALGFKSFYAFRNHYAVLERKHFGPRSVDVVTGYQHLDELQERTQRFSMRVTRDQCEDLPPKIYQKVYFDLSPEARKVYDTLRAAGIAELKSGGVVTVALILTLYLRLQQVASGYLPIAVEIDDDDEITTRSRVEQIGTKNARLTAFIESVEKLPGQGIIWCRFTQDVDDIMQAAREHDIAAVRYDGLVAAADKATAVERFQGGAARWFVAKPRSAGRGHDLAAANWVSYYSHDWSLRMRLQSEDRAQSLKKHDAVLYIDFIANDTVDDKIVAALREKKNLSDIITGDEVENWL